jgi:phosphoribosylaminoimidazolecarboxamide formyltransferase/IMP cyclohydrolase
MAEQIADVFTEVCGARLRARGAGRLRRKKNVRLLRVPSGHADPVEFRPISGGVLAQAVDRIHARAAGPEGGGDDPALWRLATGDPADEATLADLASPGVRCGR